MRLATSGSKSLWRHKKLYTSLRINMIVFLRLFTWTETGTSQQVLFSLANFIELSHPAHACRYSHRAAARFELAPSYARLQPQTTAPAAGVFGWAVWSECCSLHIAWKVESSGLRRRSIRFHETPKIWWFALGLHHPTEISTTSEKTSLLVGINNCSYLLHICIKTLIWQV